MSPSASRYYTMVGATASGLRATGSGGNNRSTGGKNKSKGPPVNATSSGNPNAISAHCWLIDSSDTERDTRNRRPTRRQDTRQSPYLSSTIDYRRHNKPPHHLTVAVARQTEQQQLATQRFLDNNNQMRGSQSVASTLGRWSQFPNPLSQSNSSDFTSNLKSNSQQLERILSRQPPANPLNAAELMSPSSVSTSSETSSQCQNSTPPSTSFHSDEGGEEEDDNNDDFSQRNYRSKQKGLRSNKTQAKRRANGLSDSNTQVASTIVRLSALMSVVSNLVKRGPKCLSSRVSARRSLSSCTIPIDELQPTSSFASASVYRLHDQPTVSNHVMICQQQKRDLDLKRDKQVDKSQINNPHSTAYTAASLAISSSSSTSAYATGGSSSNRSVVGQELLRLKQLKQNSTGGSTGGSSSMFYSSSLNSTQGQPHSLHAYEYCYDNSTQGPLSEKQQLELNGSGSNNNHLAAHDEEETRFMGRQAEVREAGTAGSCIKLPSSSQSNLSSETTSSSSGAREAVTMNLGARSDNRLAAQLMSDHELISAASDSHLPVVSGSNTNSNSRQTTISVHANRHNPTNQAPARRRWWWNSLTFKRPWRVRTRSSDSDLTSDPLAMINCSRGNSMETTRYKSLRGTTGARRDANFTVTRQPATLSDLERASRRSTRKSGGVATSLVSRQSSKHNPPRPPEDQREDRCTSTLDNVISLAKVDRVFRYRLLASVLVSLILFALICLLIGVIYSKSLRMYQQNRFSLLIDDSDYDLSWLWPPEQRYNSKNNAQNSRASDEMRRKSQTKFQEQIDASIRGHLLLIERSERLNQFQQTIAHLTNIQLANNDYIDLTSFTDQLLGFQPSDYQTFAPSTEANRTKLGTETSNLPEDLPASSRIKKISYLPKLTELDQDLVGLTLLSNLYWPLVKWRQQTSQKSFANIFSFAMAPIVTFNLHHGNDNNINGNNYDSNNGNNINLSPSNQVGIRNLLSMLMLAESEPELLRSFPTSNSYDLQQFIIMSNLIKQTSHHLISCSNLLFKLDHRRISRSSDILKRKFCHLLSRRYHRMMLTLSQLDHRHLAELYDQLEIPASFLDPNQPKFRPSKTLLGFFLDRLSLLDPNLIAEMVVAEADELDIPLDDGQDNLIGKSIDLLFQYDTIPATNANITSDQTSPKSAIKSTTLIELAKSIVGENPLRFNLETDKSTRELHAARLAQLKQDHPSKWRDEMSRDLLNPWISHQLPPFIQPQTYDLFLHPNLTSRLLLGMTKIEFILERPTRYLILNCDRLNLVELTLWFKVPSLAGGGRLNGTDENSDAAIKNGLKQVAIKRVVQNHKFEQMYIELRDMIDPIASSTSNSNQDQLTARQISPDFGELPFSSINSNGQSSVLTSTGQRRFVLNLSFNKTSLMASKSGLENEDDITNNRREQNGLVFVQYADYFAQPEAEVKSMLYTQLEPSNARQLFPCLDQPNLRAKFQLNLVHDQQHQVLFNSLKREKVPYTSDGSLQMSVFEETPIPIGTHLVALVVGDNQNMKSITSRLVQLQSLRLKQQQQQQQHFKPTHQVNQKDLKYIQVQILSQFEHLGQAEFASQLVPQLLAFYQTHLQQSYPMEKMDLVAIPLQSHLSQSQLLQLNTNQQQHQIDRSIGSFGLLLFKSSQLLLDPNLINQNLIEQISSQISHQLAYQYLGNLIAPRSWSDLWIYEALCQYLESVALSSVQLDWKLDEQFPVSSIHEALLAGDDIVIDSNTLMGTGAGTISGTGASSIGSQSVGSSSPIIEDLPMTSPVVTSSGGDSLVDSSIGESHYSNYNNNDELEPNVTGHQSKHSADLMTQSTGSKLNLAPANNNKGSAVVHMLLFNLLPSIEAQARLLRRCLTTYRLKTMGSLQFWRQFGEQLTLEGSSEPQTQLDVGKFLSPRYVFNYPTVNGTALYRPIEELVSPLEGQMHHNNHQQKRHLKRQIQLSDQNERVVFVRTGSGKLEANFESHQQQTEDLEPNGIDLQSNRMRSSSRLVDNLDLVASIWMERRGFPLVTVHTYRDRIHLKQERLSPAWSQLSLDSDQGTGEQVVEPSRIAQQTQSSDGRNEEQEVDPSVWPIPLMFVSRFNPKWPKFFWMHSAEMELPFNGQDQDHQNYVALSGSSTKLTSSSFSPPWFKLNVNQSSLVRVNYDDRNWESLSDLLSKSHYSNHLLNPLDRANLLDDALTLMRMGKLNVGLAMNLTLYLEVGEREYAPWNVVLKLFDHLQTLLNQNPLWHRYVLKLMQPIGSVIGWKDDGPHLMRKLRRQLFSLALQMGDDKTVAKAKQEFKNWFKNNRFIVPNLQEIVYVAGVRYGDQQEWFHCWHKYQQLVSVDLVQVTSKSQNGLESTIGKQNLPIIPAASNVAGNQQSILTDANGDSYGGSSGENEKKQLLTALASTQNTWLLEQFLNYSIDSTKIQPHHLKHVMQTLGKNPVARLYLWRFVRLNWNTLIEKYGFMQYDSMQNMDYYSEEDSGDQKDHFDHRDTYQTQQQQILETMILESTKHFATKLDYEEVKVFFDTKRRQHQVMMQKLYQHPNQQANWPHNLERAILSSLEVIRSNIYWRNQIEPKLTRWLSHFE